MTTKSYYNNSYLTEFTTEISEQRIIGDKIAVLLKDTYFYPTSGGQEHDLGSINGNEIIEIIEENGEILHIIKNNLTDEIAKCKIDWNRRFDFMQQHTGQHILSETIQKLFGYETISSRLALEYSSIDINCSSIDQKKNEAIEKEANRIIYNNLDVKIYYVEANELGNIPLRKAPKVTGEVRIIEIDGFDYSACGGTHTRKTGEVGIIKIIKNEKIKGNLTRLEFLCGFRALTDYQSKNNLINDLSNQLTTKDIEIPHLVQKLFLENKENIKKINLYKNEILKFEALDLFQKAIVDNQLKIVKQIFHDREISDIRILAQKLLENENCIVLFGIIDKQANIILARSSNLNYDMMQLFQSIANIIEAKGGGKPDFVQAGCKNSDKLEYALSLILRNL